MKSSFRFIFVVSIILLVASMGFTHAQSQGGKKTIPILALLLLNDEWPFIPLNDTGIIWSGDYPVGNDDACLIRLAPPYLVQDCHHGRDSLHLPLDDLDGHAGFSFTKLSSSGAELPSIATTWACVKDRVTGLVWEVKQNLDGVADPTNFHDADNTYRWGGKTRLGSGYGTYYPDWDGLVDGSNSAALCGFSNWRVPTITELQGLVNFNRIDPAIDTAYFPDIFGGSGPFWSSSPYASDSDKAWSIIFDNGNSHFGSRNIGKHVRLVRSGQ